MTTPPITNGTIWACSKAGKAREVAQYLKNDASLLHTADEHGNTPLYYAALAGHMNLVRNLSKLGARDCQYGRCYLNALNLEIRKVLATFNNYSQNVQTQKMMSHSFQTEEVTLQQCMSQLYDRMMEASSVDDNLCTEEEENLYSDVTLVLKSKDGVHQRYKCHLFVLLSRWEEFTELLMSHSGGSGCALATRRLLIHKFMRGPREIEIKGIDPLIFEVILKWIYTGRIQSERLFESSCAEFKKELLFSDIRSQVTYKKNNIPAIVKLLEASQALPIAKLYNTIVAVMKKQKIAIEGHVKLPKPKVLRNNKGKKAAKQADPPEPDMNERRDMIKEYKIQETSTFNADFAKCIFSAQETQISITHRVLRELCDVKLTANGEEKYIYCPRTLLQLRSDYFMLMLGGDSFADMISFQDELKLRNDAIDQAIERADIEFFKKEADAPKCEVHDCNRQSLLATVKYMASDKVMVLEDTFDAVFLAMRFGLIGMKRILISRMFESLNEYNALVLFTLASDTDTFSNLRSDALAIIVRILRGKFSGHSRIQDSENYLLEQGVSEDILVQILEKLY